jgi:hypothetical protein
LNHEVFASRKINLTSCAHAVVVVLHEYDGTPAASAEVTTAFDMLVNAPVAFTMRQSLPS